MDVSPSDLDRILEQKFGIKNSEQSSASNLASAFTDKIRNFLNQASDINGADFSKNHLRQVLKKSFDFIHNALINNVIELYNNT